MSRDNYQYGDEEESNRLPHRTDESEYPPIGEMSRAEELQLISKNHNIWRDTNAYWRPHLDRAKKNWAALLGDSMTPEEKAFYASTETEIYQIPIILPKINALTGFQRATRRDGIVVPQGDSDVEGAKIRNQILKTIRQQTNLDQEESNAFLNGVVSSFPAAITIELEDHFDRERDIGVFSELWNAVIPDPGFKRHDVSDAEFYIRQGIFSVPQLISAYPNREKHIKKYAAINAGKEFGETIAGLTSDDRATMISSAEDSQERFENEGKIVIIERNHFVYKNTKAYVHPEIDEPEILPPEWSDQEKQEWIEMNPDYSEVLMNLRVLFVTTTSTKGLLLENDVHWFQEGRFNVAWFIPAMFNNVPHGWVEFLIDSQRMNSTGRTLYIHSLKYANDKLMIVKENVLSNPADAGIEKAKSGGVIFLKEDANRDDIWFEGDQGGNQGYLELSAVSLDDLDVISAINPAMIGQQESANESNAGMERRISQAQTAQGQYMDNFNMFTSNVRKIILDAIPYAYDYHKILRYTDENDQTQEVEVNAPQEVNPFNGEVMSVANDLSSGHYDYLLATGDNSVTGKENESRVFADLVQNVLANVSQDMWPVFLRNFPNRLAKEFGEELQAQMDAQREAQRAGDQSDETEGRVQVTFKGEDIISKDPTIMEILEKQEMIKPRGNPQGQMQVPQQNMMENNDANFIQ